MIIELLCTPLFLLLNLIISLLPEGFVIPSYITNTIEILKYPLSIFPIDLWILIISNVSFWYIAQVAWAIIEWVYKKIPGLN